MLRDLNYFDNRMISSETEFLDAFDCDARKEMGQMIYGETECGAWIEFDDNGFSIGSIVEGSDAEFSETFTYPFQSDTFFDYVDTLERQVEEAFREANDEEPTEA
jgi:hypothetical protein